MGAKSRVGNFWSKFFEHFSYPPPPPYPQPLGRRSGVRSELRKRGRGRHVWGLWGGVCLWIHFDSHVGV